MDFNKKYRTRLERLSTTNVSDAMDALGYRGATFGIRPMTPQWGKCAGPAVTLKMTAAGETKGKHHLGVKAIDAANEGDIVIIDNGGRLDTSCWGGILANGAKMKGITAVMTDGHRDIYRIHFHPVLTSHHIKTFRKDWVVLILNTRNITADPINQRTSNIFFHRCNCHYISPYGAV